MTQTIYLRTVAISASANKIQAEVEDEANGNGDAKVVFLMPPMPP